MRLSTRSGDMGAEGRICELAANVGGNCPAGADECGAASSVAGTTDTMCAAFLGQHFDVTCHSLGGAWCQCNGVHDAAFIGTQCPTDATGAPCRNLADRPGTCCVNNANPGATDPVQSCVDAFCGANIGIPIPIVPGIPAPVVPIPDSAGVAQCMYFAGQGNLDMHNAVDYQQCLGRGIVAPGVALPPSCGFAAGANVGPPLPGGPVTCTPNAATGGLDCACGPDVPYCGDNFTPCCAQTYGGRTDGCGPHQRCDRGLGPQGGPGMCVPVANDCSAFSPFDDWESSQIGNLGSLWEISDIIGNWTWIPGAAWPRCTMLGASEIIWNMNDIPGSWDISWNSQIGGGGGILKCSMDCPCGGEQNIYVRRNAAATCGWEMGYGQNGCNPCRPTETCGQILGGANLPPGGMDVCCNGPIAACLNNAGVPCDWVSRAPDGRPSHFASSDCDTCLRMYPPAPPPPAAAVAAAPICPAARMSCGQAAVAMGWTADPNDSRLRCCGSEYDWTLDPFSSGNYTTDWSGCGVRYVVQGREILGRADGSNGTADCYSCVMIADDPSLVPEQPPLAPIPGAATVSCHSPTPIASQCASVIGSLLTGYSRYGISYWTCAEVWASGTGSSSREAAIAWCDTQLQACKDNTWRSCCNARITRTDTPACPNAPPLPLPAAPVIAPAAT